MTVIASVTEVTIPGATAASDFGMVGIRVVVLPKKAGDQAAEGGDPIVDLTEDEMILEEGSSPVGSYLERQKGGKLCCVFLVNGQRQDGLDNSLIVQQLGFKYLRKRMMIIVDVDGLRPEALGELMQGSRQGFYKGRVWEAMFSRLVSTLKGDPDLQKLEEEAEAEVAELQAGDQKVKAALDSLIDAHHHYADHVVAGGGFESGRQQAQDVLGAGGSAEMSLVTLDGKRRGEAADYPVLTATPPTSSMSLRPGVERVLTLAADPTTAWESMTALTHELDSPVPQLHIAEDRDGNTAALRLRFDPPADFDSDDYPVRTNLRVLASFDGFKEPRQVSVALRIAPITPVPDPVLLPVPTYLRVSTRQPVQLSTGDADTHVRLRWDGRDDLAAGPRAAWRFEAHCLNDTASNVSTSFSLPRKGRFSLLVGLAPEMELGTELEFEIVATSRDGAILRTTFHGVVAEPPAKVKPEPRLLAGTAPIGASRRPDYDLRYVKREKWDSGTCFGAENWTGEDAAAFQEPTDKQPLTLLINEDMTALEDFRKDLTARKLVESEVQSRITKYTSHVAFHLYQMYKSLEALRRENSDDAPREPTPQEQRAEIRRVAMTLLRLMEVSR